MALNCPEKRKAMRPMLNREKIDVLGVIVFAEDALLQLPVCRLRTRYSSSHMLRADNLMATVGKAKF